MVSQGQKPPRLRRKRGPLGIVTRDKSGEIYMIRLLSWRESPLAPVILTTHIGGIQRLSDGLVRATYVREIPGSENTVEYEASCHLVWTERRWLDNADCVRWILAEYSQATHRGEEPGGDGRARRRGN